MRFFSPYAFRYYGFAEYRKLDFSATTFTENSQKKTPSFVVSPSCENIQSGTLCRFFCFTEATVFMHTKSSIFINTAPIVLIINI